MILGWTLLGGMNKMAKEKIRLLNDRSIEDYRSSVWREDPKTGEGDWLRQDVCGRDNIEDLIRLQDSGVGYLPSEGDLRLIGVRDFEFSPYSNDSWATSTLSLLDYEKQSIKVVHPYTNKNKKLTDLARLGLTMCRDEGSMGFVDDEAIEIWEKFQGHGVYTLSCKDLILGKRLTREEAKSHPLILTGLGHQDYVDNDFSRPIEEVEEIIDKTYSNLSLNGWTGGMKQQIHPGDATEYPMVILAPLAIGSHDVTGSPTGTAFNTHWAPFVMTDGK
jgi:hypothetical protein